MSEPKSVLPNQSLRSDALVPEAAYSKLAQKALRFNTIVLSVVIGLCCGIGLLAATYLSIALTGAQSGHYLNLLGVFMPGYSATALGAWAGFFWAFVYSALSSAVVFLAYARAIRMNFDRSLSFDGKGRNVASQLVIMVSPAALGIAVGAILAAQLILSTGWLVVTGRAANSPHAALLANYLPFYSVSLPGALIGGIGIFLYGFVFAYIFAFFYNLYVKLSVGSGRAR